MTVLFVDGKPRELAHAEGNLLQALLTLGYDVPYFCWHPALGSVGACRQCAVKVFRDKNDTRGQIVMSCMTPVRDGMLVSVDDATAKRFRKSVIEWLMLNHPHDCPVCDEGGQCHLQDVTVMTGHNCRTTRFPKRTHRSQDLGPFLQHEMNRCIQCYRCVRFYREYAGGKDLAALGAHHHVYFGREASGALESEFAGNLAEVCPTGVFTDKPARARYARKWDLTTAPSICAHCGLGCNTIVAARYGRVVRVENRYHPAINGYFLCDRGRFARDFVESEKRIRTPLVREASAGGLQPASAVAAVKQAAALLGNKAIGIGSPRASLEGNFALRELVGVDRFYLGLSAQDARLASLALQILRTPAVPAYSLHEIEDAEAALILGEDVANTAPRLALALRQTARRQPARAAAATGIPAWQAHSIADAIHDRLGPLYIAGPVATRLDEIATRTYRAAPDDVARLGFAVAAAFDDRLPRVADLPAEVAALVAEIAAALKPARRTVVVAGLWLGSEAVLLAAAHVVGALRGAGFDAGLCLVPPEANTFGLALLGGRPLADAFALARQGEVETALVLENDLHRRAPAAAVDEFFAAVKNFVALDCVSTRTATRASVVLPAATWAESDGAFVNNEGRAQRFYRVIPPQELVRDSWRWLDALAGVNRDLDGVAAALAASSPEFAALPQAAPDAKFRLLNERVPMQPRRFSGRTAIDAAVEVSEPKPPLDPDSAFAFSMEGCDGQPPPALTPFYWSPNWNSVQALNKFQAEVGGPLRGGEPGARLLAPDGPSLAPSSAPPAFAAPADHWLLLPIQTVFGSDELSALSPAIAARILAPFVALNDDAAKALGATAGDALLVELDDEAVRLPLAIEPLPHGVAAVWAGPDGADARPPAWARIRKEAR
jgi:NADH-quinone oxidoreductase subunit G